MVYRCWDAWRGCQQLARGGRLRHSSLCSKPGTHCLETGLLVQYHSGRNSRVGLNLRPATLADLLGLSPGTQCDLGGCNPIGNGLTEGVVLGAGGTIVCQIADPCGAIEDTALLILLLTTAIVLEKTTTFQPCIPPAGTQCYEMHKGHTHNGWDPHYRIWTRNQVPSIGKCYWNEGHGTRGTTELPPAGMQECSTYSTWPNN